MKTRYPTPVTPSTPHVADHPSVPLPKLQEGTRAIEAAELLTWFEEEEGALVHVRSEAEGEVWRASVRRGAVYGFGATPLDALTAAMPMHERPEEVSGWTSRSTNDFLRRLETSGASIEWTHQEERWVVESDGLRVAADKHLAVAAVELGRWVDGAPMLSELSKAEVTLVELPPIYAVEHDDFHGPCPCGACVWGRKRALLLEWRERLMRDIGAAREAGGAVTENAYDQGYVEGRTATLSGTLIMVDVLLEEEEEVCCA